MLGSNKSQPRIYGFCTARKNGGPQSLGTENGDGCELSSQIVWLTSQYINHITHCRARVHTYIYCTCCYMYMYMYALHTLYTYLPFVSPGVSVTDSPGHSQRGVWESEGRVTETIWRLLTVLATAKGAYSPIHNNVQCVQIYTMCQYTCAYLLWCDGQCTCNLSGRDTSNNTVYTSLTFILHHVSDLFMYNVFMWCSCDVRCGCSLRGRWVDFIWRVEPSCSLSQREDLFVSGNESSPNETNRWTALRMVERCTCTRWYMYTMVHVHVCIHLSTICDVLIICMIEVYKHKTIDTCKQH